jgi:hypothetical protein
MGKNYVTTELLHIAKKDQHSRFEDLLIYRSQNDQCYYVDMPHSPTVKDQQPTKLTL